MSFLSHAKNGADLVRVFFPIQLIYVLSEELDGWIIDRTGRRSYCAVCAQPDANCIRKSFEAFESWFRLKCSERFQLI